MNKRYYELTEDERIALTPEHLYDAVKIEAISRGIAVPIPLSDELKQSGYVGFQVPPDSVRVYEIQVAKAYSTPAPTGLAFRSEQDALDLISAGKLLVVYDEGYGATARKLIGEGPISVVTQFISRAKAGSYTKTLDKVFENDEAPEFVMLCEECRDDQYKIKAERRDTELRKQKRAEYVRLAGGNLEIAAAFWAKVEKGEFPPAE